jgi:hypothetical protein
MRARWACVVLLAIGCGEDVEPDKCAQPDDDPSQCEAGVTYLSKVDLCDDGEGVCVVTGDQVACMPACNDDGGDACASPAMMWSTIATDCSHVCYCE